VYLTSSITTTDRKPGESKKRNQLEFYFIASDRQRKEEAVILKQIASAVTRVGW
jgi:hypothetical protein